MNIETERKIIAFVAIFGLYFGFCYCFIFGSNTELVWLKVFLSFVLFFIIWTVYSNFYINIYKRYEDGDVMKNSLNVYNDSSYVVTQPRPSIDLKIKDQTTSEYYNLTLKDFYIPCSYKSYVVTGNSHALCNIEAIGHVINKGARCVHLNVYSNMISNFERDAIPVVRNDTMAKKFGTPLLFEDCCNVIATSVRDSSPFLVYLEFDNSALRNHFVMERVASILHDTFSTRIFQNDNGPVKLENVPIASLMNKIILLSNDTKREGILQQLLWPVPSSQYNYDRVCYNAGGLIGRYNQQQLDDIIPIAKQELTLCIPINEYDFLNIKSNKSDLVNPSPDECFKYGIQMVFMNYQLFDKHMKKYVEEFKDDTFILKPDQLRQFPSQPKPPTPTVDNTIKEVIQRTDNGGLWMDIRL